MRTGAVLRIHASRTLNMLRIQERCSGYKRGAQNTSITHPNMLRIQERCSGNKRGAQDTSITHPNMLRIHASRTLTCALGTLH